MHTPVLPHRRESGQGQGGGFSCATDDHPPTPPQEQSTPYRPTSTSTLRPHPKFAARYTLKGLPERKKPILLSK
jgi:hypothetical protein